jgi:hypothetical protein
LSAASAPRSLGRGPSLLLLGTLGVLVAINLPELGSDPWPFRAPPAEPRGVLGPLVRAAGGEWQPGLLRAAATVAGLLVAVTAALVLVGVRLRRWAAVAVSAAVVGLLVVPGGALQAGLRDGTAPWFHDNDSTYQIDIAGELLRRGDNPYGHDYSFSGLERFYSRDGSVSARTRAEQVALRHFAYFPGTPLSAAVWGLLPSPFDDYRFFVMLATLAMLPVALLFARAPVPARTAASEPGPPALPFAAALALGAALAANPLAVRAAWFGTADAPAIVLIVLAFALVMRSRLAWAAAALGGAVLLKQFAVVAVPFLAAVLVRQAARRDLGRAALAFSAVLAAGFLPFLIVGPAELIADTIAYGGGTYRIIGYGLAGVLLEAGVIGDRFGPYPFGLLALVVWLPVTALLVRTQLRSPAAWTAAAGFGTSIFLLFFLGRVFQTSYLVWPLAAALLAGLLWLRERSGPIASAGAAEASASTPGLEDPHGEAAARLT